MGRLDAATAKLQQALKVEPDNKAVQYYLRLVGEAKYVRPSRVREDGAAHPPLMSVPRAPEVKL